jgi:hypothetical protein
MWSNSFALDRCASLESHVFLVVGSHRENDIALWIVYQFNKRQQYICVFVKKCRQDTPPYTQQPLKTIKTCDTRKSVGNHLLTARVVLMAIECDCDLGGGAFAAPLLVVARSLLAAMPTAAASNVGCSTSYVALSYRYYYHRLIVIIKNKQLIVLNRTNCQFGAASRSSNHRQKKKNQSKISPDTKYCVTNKPKYKTIIKFQPGGGKIAPACCGTNGRGS